MSIKSLKTGREFLWQGDKSIWAGRSPILFPIVGRAMNDRLKIDGKEYEMTIHGFARKTEFKLYTQGNDYIEYLLTQNEDTLAKFPYKFNLFVRYTLIENTLKITYTVENTDEKEICFSIGAHPGFNCKIGDVLEFEKNETLCTQVLNSEHYRDLQLPYLNNENMIIIDKNTFEHDALVFENTKSDFIVLKSQIHSYSIKYNYYNAPFLGIWAKPNAPYVCIEPWFGADDLNGTDYDFSEKPTAMNLSVGNKFEYSMLIEFSEN